ncbi:oxidoreductase [Erwinia tracheiphila]|uniref:Oxidoreductase n=1 Tax=Erwinia tracheiphila TaxID=65700 RepID=A0A345CQR2_9GAMM|nr:oxidoreductase [Erwinia tracheiphila]AXF75779.1 oxidoreductase [Erwinia tracheiphila]UIA81673.1 oxidoreductase [Erwinia tracheiphila]UIA94094.1 oxidoreductase [Erwinia tracheiphila]
MEQRRFSGYSHWYHETQCTLRVPSAALVPEAAEVEDHFLPGIDALCSAELKNMLDCLQPLLQASRDFYHLLFPQKITNSMTHTLTLYDRLSAALTVAQVAGVQRLCNHYAARLNPLTSLDSSRESNHRLTQMTEYARQLASQPDLITPLALRRLDDVGLTTPDIITYSQLIGFISYQARVMAGIHALLSLPARWIPGFPEREDAAAECFADTAPWRPLLPPVELRYASASQLEVLTWCQPQPMLNDCAWLLAHDASALQGWGMLINRLQENGATSEGALAAAVVARINGSAACLQHFDDKSLGDALRKSVAHALKVATQSGQAVIQAAAQLTRSPERFSAAHIKPLNDAGLSPQVIFDVILQTALANWCNRLQQALGTTLSDGALKG